MSAEHATRVDADAQRRLRALFARKDLTLTNVGDFINDVKASVCGFQCCAANCLHWLFNEHATIDVRQLLLNRQEDLTFLDDMHLTYNGIDGKHLVYNISAATTNLEPREGHTSHFVYRLPCYGGHFRKEGNVYRKPEVCTEMLSLWLAVGESTCRTWAHEVDCGALRSRVATEGALPTRSCVSGVG